MISTMTFADLRRDATPNHQDLRAWRFRSVWADDDTATVLAWASEQGCVLHEAQCPAVPTTGEPTATGRMAEARELFAEEQPKGTFRWFGFCGRCLTERIPNYGWEPSERDLAMLATMRQVLNDVRLLGRKPIPKRELVGRMRRYGEAPTPTELKRLIELDRQQRDEDAPDLSIHLIQ